MNRLRWQLTISHLKAIAFTLVSMTIAIALIVTSWFHSQNNPAEAPAREARMIAGIIVNVPGDKLDAALADLTHKPVLMPWSSGWQPNGWFEWSGAVVENAAYAVVIATDGRVVASSEPDGARFEPPERAEWAHLASAALRGETDLRQLNTRRSGPGPVALGAAPMRDGQEHVHGAVVLAKSVLAEPWLFGELFQALVALGASLVMLLAASIFALISAGVVGYLLARKLVERLERLGAAAQSLAAGDLSKRVQPEGDDEVALLGRQFNHMADRLSTTVAELETTLRTKRELVANVSHELRTPLASIRGHVESLTMQRPGDADGRVHEYLLLINREAEHLGRLIDDLFLLSTSESGGLPLTMEDVAVGPVVQEVADQIEPIARRERRVSVVVEVAPDLPPARADRRRLLQILGNLVRNAVRHTPEGGLVSIRAALLVGMIELAVEDTGVGIPPEHLSRVWERFYRTDEARARENGGAGLGLAIVKELAEAMGGSVSAASVAGEGSRFTVRLPAAA